MSEQNKIQNCYIEAARELAVDSAHINSIAQIIAKHCEPNPLAPLIKIGEQVQGIKHVKIEGNAPNELNKLASDLMDYFESDKYTYGLRSENVKQIEAFLKKSQEAAIVEAIQFLWPVTVSFIYANHSRK